VLRVETIRVARPFDSTTFVYKIGSSEYTHDYYNGFIVSPERIIASQLTDWLASSRIFASVIDGGSAADYQLSLESNVTALYGDYSKPKHPAAVIEIRFFMIDEREGRYRVVFEKTYRESEPVAGNKPQQLVDAWAVAYKRLLMALLEDMRQPPVAELANIDPH
jgi:ABC-type uncharacterized transport system auxiliary subunit